MVRLMIAVTGWVLFFSGQALASIQIQEGLVTVDSGSDSEPAVSGDDIVFTSDRLGTNDILWVDVNGIVSAQAIGPSSQREADADAGRVVYVDDGAGNANIVINNIGGGNLGVLTTDPGRDDQPAISGDLVVFRSNRLGNSDILIVDVNVGVTETFAVTADAESAPAIDGDLVAWQVLTGGTFDIMAARVGDAAFAVATGPGNQITPSVSGDRVAYINGGDVEVVDTVTGLVTQVTNDAFSQHAVKIFGDVVVWSDDRNGDDDIFLYDLLDGQTYQLTTDPAFNQFVGDVDGARVVFTDARAGDNNIWELVYDINHEPIADAGADQNVVFGDTAQLNGSATDLDGDLIVSWSWTIDSAPIGSTAALLDPTIPNPAFTPDMLGQYILSLIVNDGLDDSAPDSLILEVTCDDNDGDLHAECQGDCDDTNPDTFPGAPEVNDGLDNQCPGDPGYGVVDEMSGNAGFLNAADDTEYSWPAQLGATTYQVARSTSADFSADCTTLVTSTALINDTDEPLLGEVRHLLVRPLTPNAGSWGQNSAGIERSFLCGSESACSDGVDNDLDGLTDCDDPDCLSDAACQPDVFSFTDTGANDIGVTGLFGFFAALSATPSDYIFFEIVGSVGAYAWCGQQASLYRNAYLSFAPTAGVLNSGGWSKWFRTPATGSSWVGPTLIGFTNSYGASCFEAYSWCSEPGLAGQTLTVRPAQAGTCEAFHTTQGGCGNGTWRLTIKVAPSRLSACGF